MNQTVQTINPANQMMYAPVNQSSVSTKKGKWVESLLASDVNRIWSELYRIVATHPLSRAAHHVGLFSSGSNENYFNDLTQELFVRLFGKGRFNHYIESEMSDAEIECEISQLELKNLLTTELRKRFPESYRLARRIATILHSNRRFRRFDNGRTKLRRVSEQVYGLSEWSTEKVFEETVDLEKRICRVPVKQRDTRMVGRTGDSQIIIGNAGLEELIVAVLKALDQPVPIRVLRQFVMSRLPVMDVNIVSLTNDDRNKERIYSFEPIDEREDVERIFLRSEGHHEAALQADIFLQKINELTCRKPKQTRRAHGVLWYCYLAKPHKTQFEAALLLGVSGSLVSNYCCRIEKELRSLKFSDVEVARIFEQILRKRLRDDWEGKDAEISLGNISEKICTLFGDYEFQLTN